MRRVVVTVAYALLLPAFFACPFHRLLVNLVTSVTLGLALAAEPAEPDVMDRPPRRPNKRLVGKLLLWRCFFVCHLVVVLVLGMFEWALTTRLSLGQARAEAFNVLVGAQVVYFNHLQVGGDTRCHAASPVLGLAASSRGGAGQRLYLRGAPALLCNCNKLFICWTAECVRAHFPALAQRHHCSSKQRCDGVRYGVPSACEPPVGSLIGFHSVSTL